MLNWIFSVLGYREHLFLIHILFCPYLSLFLKIQQVFGFTLPGFESKFPKLNASMNTTIKQSWSLLVTDIYINK